MLYDHLDRDHHCLLQGPSWSYLACKLKIYAKWKSKQIENLCTLKLYANWNFMQIESLCKSKIHANWKFRQIENWTSKKLKWRYLKKWKSKVGACRLKMRSPFKRSGRGQCQGSRLKTIPGCKKECAFLLLLLLALTSVIIRLLRDPGIFSKSRSRDSQKSNPGIFRDFQKPLNDCNLRLSTPLIEHNSLFWDP